jgi:hypothetical protein
MSRCSDRVAVTEYEDDRDAGGGGLGSESHPGTAVCGDYRNLLANQLGDKRCEPVVLTACPAELDRHIAPFYISGLSEALSERGDIRAGRKRGLLRARRNSRRRRAAQQRDEFAAFHVWMAPAWQEIFGRAAQRSLAVMCPAC